MLILGPQQKNSSINQILFGASFAGGVNNKNGLNVYARNFKQVPLIRHCRRCLSFSLFFVLLACARRFCCSKNVFFLPRGLID